jgi:hypothetical protein
MGGAIFFSNGNGQCVLDGVCGCDCYSTYPSSSWSSAYQFATIRVNNIASSKNYGNYSSIVRCVNGRSNSQRILCHSDGKICCSSVNMSMNKCQDYAGITCWPFKDSNSATCSLTYSSFSDNIANGSICHQLNANGANFEIKSCNILRNTEVSRKFGIIITDSNLMVEDSCILENTVINIFYQVNSNYTITVSNCTVDSTSKYGNVVTRNIVKKGFILTFQHKIATQDMTLLEFQLLYKLHLHQRNKSVYVYMFLFSTLFMGVFRVVLNIKAPASK